MTIGIETGIDNSVEKNYNIERNEGCLPVGKKRSVVTGSLVGVIAVAAVAVWGYVIYRRRW